jgi:H+/gluconate symporter-like permease
MLAFGLWWLGRAEASARKSGEGSGDTEPGSGTAADDQFIRARATSSHEFDPAEIAHGKHGEPLPPIGTAIIPLVVVVGVNLVMSFLILPRLDFAFLAQERWGGTSLAGVAGVWSVAVALAAATATLVVLQRARLPDLRGSMDAGANASVLPILSVASLVGFGAVVAALPAFGLVREWVLSISGGPLVSLAIATNVLAGVTGSASGGLTIALDALGDTYLQIAQTTGIDPALMHRIAVIGSGTLDSLPHNGAVVTLLAVCGSTHRKSYFDMVMANIVGPIIALIVVIALGSMLGSF